MPREKDATKRRVLPDPYAGSSATDTESRRVQVGGYLGMARPVLNADAWDGIGGVVIFVPYSDDAHRAAMLERLVEWAR